MKKPKNLVEWICAIIGLLFCVVWGLDDYCDTLRLPYEAIITGIGILPTLWAFISIKKRLKKRGSSTAEFETLLKYLRNGIEYKIPKHLTTLPFLPTTFFGREPDIEAIHDRLFNSKNSFIMLVNGEGGIGKSAVASKYFHRYQHEYAHVGWAYCENNIADALLRLEQPLGIQYDSKSTVDERLNSLFLAMAELNKPSLLILDNANDFADLEARYLQLRSFSNFHVLLTTRLTDFEPAETYYIGGLPKDDALNLFEQHYRTLTSDECTLFLKILEAVGDNTLVLELLAKNLKEVNILKTRYSLSEYLVELQTKGVLHLTHTHDVTTDYQTKGGKLRKEKPEDIIGAMYDIGELPQEEVALLSVLAVLPAESIPFSNLESLLADSPELETSLLSLYRKGWIEFDHKSTTFKCSPVVQEVVRLKNPNLKEHCQLLIVGLSSKLRCDSSHLIGSSYQEAALFARYAKSLVSILKTNDDDLGTLYQNVGAYHNLTGDLGQALNAFQKMKEIQSALLSESPRNPDLKNSLAISYSKLGETNATLGNLPEALQYYEKYHQLEKELYEAYPTNVDFKNGLAISYHKLGVFFKISNDSKNVLKIFRDAEKLWIELVRDAPAIVEFQKNLQEVRRDIAGLT